MHKGPLVVRAVDVGYGHIKFTDGRDTTGNIRTDSIPSQSPGTKPAMHKGIGVMKQRDTFVIPISGHYYEVGRDVLELAEQVSQGGLVERSLEVLDHLDADAGLVGGGQSGP